MRFCWYFYSVKTYLKLIPKKKKKTYFGLCCLDWQFLFKKYLDYEKSQGDEERIESVKRKAMEYVESTMA